MNYTEIKAMALGFADRSDVGTVNNMDNFLRMAESRVNRQLRTMKMTEDTNIAVVSGQTLYALPSGFRGARLIKHVDTNNRETPMVLVTPEAYSNAVNSNFSVPTGTKREIKYFLDDDFIYLWQAQETGNINLLYYLQVPELTSLAATNWLADDYPDCYIFGLCVEISSFVKDVDAKNAWDNRFKESLSEIKYEDKQDRWSGGPMQIRVM